MQYGLEDLKQRVSIQSLVEQTVDLRPSGASLKGRCPIHDDHSPSLVVWPDSGRWKCFGCQLGGDIFSWAQAVNHMSFRESVCLLAAVAGVEMPAKATKSTSGAFDFVGGKVVRR